LLPLLAEMTLASSTPFFLTCATACTTDYNTVRRFVKRSEKNGSAVHSWPAPCIACGLIDALTHPIPFPFLFGEIP
jgi:hypothetical protein